VSTLLLTLLPLFPPLSLNSLPPPPLSFPLPSSLSFSIHLPSPAATDNELPDYIMVMLANRKTIHQIASDLKLFLGANTERFTVWLQKVITNPELLAETEEGTCGWELGACVYVQCVCVCVCGLGRVCMGVCVWVWAGMGGSVWGCVGGRLEVRGAGREG